MAAPPSTDELDALSEFIFCGQNIQAIKLYRDLTGVGLKEAKDEIEAMEALLRFDSPRKFIAQPNNAGCFGAATLFFISCCCGVVAYLILRN